jgi:tetratricopeptide (TPR) repeat protein
MTRKLLRGAAIAALPLLVMAGRCPQSGGQAATDATVPKPGDPTYRAAISAFFASVTTVQVNGSDSRALLDEALRLLPGEPAVWANQALLLLRQGKHDEAEISLKKAETLAPGNVALLVLRGLLLQSEGKFVEALAVFNKASEADPDDILALYWAAQTAERVKGPDEGKLQRAAYEKILARRPDNLAARFGLLNALANVEDRPAFSALMAELKPISLTWDVKSRAAFEALLRDAPTLKGRGLTLRVRQFYNVVKTVPDCQLGLRDLGENTFLQGAPDGKPILMPLKLVVPPATPAAPDTGLTYALEPVDAAPASATLAVALDEKTPPATFFASGATLKRTGAATGSTVPAGAVSLVAFDLNDESNPAHTRTDDLRKYRLDLAVVGPGGLRLFQSAGESLSDVTAASKLPPTMVNGNYNHVWSVDFEADGDLDLVLSPASGEPLVLQNNGDGSFAPVPGALKGVASPLKDFAWADFDGDGDPDAALIDKNGALHAFLNQRGGLFESWKDTPKPAGATALAVAETSGDTRLDLLVSQNGVVTAMSFNERGKWAINPLVKARNEASGPLLVGDLDNNGGLDLAVSGTDRTEVFLIGPEGKYPSEGTAVALSTSNIADVNNDGVLDLVGRAGGKPTHALAKPTKKYNFQTFTLRARIPGQAADKINAFAIGGEMETRAGLSYQKQAIFGPKVHLGLGEYTQVDVARVTWPNGNPQGLFASQFKGQKEIVADQALGGSCPFLFAWNGKEFVFVTDCIWRSPVGLKINAQATAGVSQTEDWVKIRGDQLVPKDGFYDLRVTAELRETHFFDHLGLMAVDHPEGTDIWIDERFSPAEKPLLKVIVTKSAQPLKSATGFDGKDVSTTLAERDKKYLDDFGRGQYQGVTKDHWVEVALPESAPKNAPLYLIAHGWLHPTDSSINVALSQNPSQAPPQGLALWTPDATGKWTLAKPNLGFPEGKLKTVVLRIDNLFKPGAARKVRLRTNLEVYWDQVRWAEGLPDATAKSTRLVSQSADLRYRGFSNVVAKDASSPELPESYANLAGTAPRWRDLEGCYTRFGDVGRLLGKIDDRYVIMNAGDELALRFPEAPKVSAGQMRDFVLIGDGWVKDGNVNTEWGQTVHPLPSHARTSYPRTNFLEDDPVYKAHEADFLEYHTRRVTTEAFTQAMKP